MKIIEEQNGVKLITEWDINSYHRHEAFTHTSITKYLTTSASQWEARYSPWRSNKVSDLKRATHFILGQAFEDLVLEGEAYFGERYVLQPAQYPAERPATKAEKAEGRGDVIIEMKPWHARAKYCAEWEDSMLASGKEILAKGQVEKIQAMREEWGNQPLLQAHATSDFLRNVSILWTDDDGVDYLARPDLLTLKGDAGWADLKTCRTIKDCLRHFADFGYHIQAGLVWRGLSRFLGREPGYGNLLMVEASELPDSSVQQMFGVVAGDDIVKAGWSKAQAVSHEALELRAKHGTVRVQQTQIGSIRLPSYVRAQVFGNDDIGVEEEIEL